MNEVVIEDVIKIEDMIYEIRGKYVMLDSDLGEFMNVKMALRQLIKLLIDILIDSQVIFIFNYPKMSMNICSPNLL